MPVILNPETMGCGFLFAVKILARNDVNQSKRDVICVTQIKQVLGVSLIEAKSVILQMPLRVLTDVKIYVCC